jgi:hypothetical protein
MRRCTMIVIVFVFLLSQACVEPFDLLNVRYNNTLVVEGHISNLNKPQQIKLSRTAAINERVFLAETGAEVTVESASGESMQFLEVKPGIYESSSFAGVVNEAYTLSITTTNGRKYKSSQVVLKDGPPIDKIYAEFVTTPERGINIAVNTEDPSGKTRNYRWEYVETYEIQTPYPSNYVVLPGATEATWRYDRVDQCWASDTLQSVLVKTTRAQDEDKVVGFSLRFIPETSYIFRIKYSILVRQYALSEEAYNYWKLTEIFNETQGSLADVQPGNIISNVIGVTNPNETVLGYFDASAVSEQRVFFNYRDFTAAGYKRPTYRTSCYELEPIYIIETEIAEYMLTNSDKVAIWDVIGTSPTALFELFPIGCCDCSNMGTTIKPSFWE